MNNQTLDQKYLAGSDKAANTTTKVQRITHTAIPEGSILERVWDFAFSIPDFRRTDKGNIRHALGDIIILMIFARMSRCVGRADMIEYGKHNLRKFQSMDLLKNGVPSEPTLCRVENGIDESGLADAMTEFIQTFYHGLVKTCCVLKMVCIDGKAMRGTVQQNGKPISMG